VTPPWVPGGLYLPATPSESCSPLVLLLSNQARLHGGLYVCRCEPASVSPPKLPTLRTALLAHRAFGPQVVLAQLVSCMHPEGVAGHIQIT
jgi:hypothetical protein